ncbi:tetratricopeptide repeat protein [Microbacterium excoecariae]|uniref:tetratricopeptide repeat protein n=1 Tax=Microbacterium excoecariae TaxID=2715210 RepID=UPI001409860B|nr:tetratricopeptide repeat protein [Microbacterium excoecariae]
MTTRIGVAVMAAVFALYIWLLGGRAVALIGAGLDESEPVALVMGIAIFVFPVLGAWALGRELLFGWRADRLAGRLASEGALPDDEVRLTPSGRVVRQDADQAFPAYRRAVEDAPDDWRAWFRLSVAYSAAGDTRRARQAARTAIRLERGA